jgi:hypothetical protein
MVSSLASIPLLGVHVKSISVHELTCRCSIRQHTSDYVSIRQHTSAYVSIRQHTSAYSTSVHELTCRTRVQVSIVVTISFIVSIIEELIAGHIYRRQINATSVHEFT